MPSASCLHCGKKPGTHARGLCSVCHRTPGVRELYPVDSTKDTDGGDPTWEHTAFPPPPEPTDAEPGSEEKLQVMEWREAHGFQVFHPLDYTPGYRRERHVWEAVVGEIARRMED